MEKGKYEYALGGNRSDEISLVDLARVVIKWRKLELSVWALCFLAGLTYVLLLPRSFEFRTIYQMAADGDKPLEAPAGLISKITNFYEPGVLQQLSKGTGDSPVSSIKVNILNPDSTSLIIMQSSAPKSREALVRSLHEQLVKRIEGEQSGLYQRKDHALKAELNSLTSQIKDLKQAKGEGQAVAIASAVSQLNAVQQHLTNLNQGQSLVLAQPSLRPKAQRRVLTILLSLILGAVLALMAGFCAEFVALVRASYSA